MRRNGAGAVLASACMLASAFIFAHAAGWLVFIFLVPLILAQHAMRLSWGVMFLWTLCFWGMQSSALVIMCYAHGQGAARIVLMVIFLSVCVGYTVVWLLAVQWLASMTKLIPLHCMVWIVGTWLFFIWMHGYAFSFLGFTCGYPCALPIIPLMAYTPCIRAVYLVGEYFFLLLIIGAQCGLAFAIINRWYYVLAALPLVFLMIFAVREPSADCPGYTQYLAYASVPHSSCMTSLDVAEAIDTAVVQVRQACPQARVILMPESSYPYPLNDHEKTRELWAENCLFSDDIHLILGSCWGQEGWVVNALCCLHKCRIICHYVKTRLMPFAEYVPALCAGLGRYCALFAQGVDSYKPLLCEHGVQKPKIPLVGKIDAEPCICCELFFDTIVAEGRDPVLCIVNDSWFSCGYMRRLLFYYGKMSAAQLKRDIIYVSYAGGWVLSPSGGALPLPTIEGRQTLW